MVWITLPFTRQPWNGEFLLLDLNFWTSIVYSSSRLNITISADFPIDKVPLSNWKISAGREVNLEIAWDKVMTPSATNFRVRGRAVSNPTIPKEASLNSTSLSTILWGAWSVAIISMISLFYYIIRSTIFQTPMDSLISSALYFQFSILQQIIHPNGVEQITYSHNDREIKSWMKCVKMHINSCTFWWKLNYCLMKL